MIYEWIQLKGKGAMHSSTGLVVTGSDMLRVAPPEVLRFYIARPQPNRHLDFDPGMGLLSLVDEFDRYEGDYLDRGADAETGDDSARTYQLSMVDPSALSEPSIKKIGVPYRHLVTLAQLTEDETVLRDKICRSEGIASIDDRSFSEILSRVECVRFWLERFAPPEVRFCLLDRPSEDHLKDLDSDMWRALELIHSQLPNLEWTPEGIHNGIYEITRSNGIEPVKAFKALYRVLLGADRGPRLGFFLATMEMTNVRSMLEASLSMKPQEGPPNY